MCGLPKCKGDVALSSFSGGWNNIVPMSQSKVDRVRAVLFLGEAPGGFRERVHSTHADFTETRWILPGAGSFPGFIISRWPVGGRPPSLLIPSLLLSPVFKHGRLCTLSCLPLIRATEQPVGWSTAGSGACWNRPLLSMRSGHGRCSVDGHFSAYFSFQLNHGHMLTCI
jgi:hypothetical protein